MASGAEVARLNALLGMLRTDLGDHEAAVGHLEIARAARPHDIRIATNLATALVRAGDLAKAYDVATLELALSDRTLQLARLRGFIANQLGDYPAAIEALEHVVASAPADWESWNNLGNALGGAEDYERCVAALERAVELNPLAAPSRLNYATALLDAGRVDEAEAELRKMANDFPTDAKPLRELHLLLKSQAREEEALEAISEAANREPSNIEFLLAMAAHQSALHQMEAAESNYRKVIQLHAENGMAHLGLSVVYELSNRADDLEALVSIAEARGLGEGTQSFIKAYHFRRKKEFEAGLAELGNVPEDIETPRRLHLLAQLLDGAGRYDEAFEAFARMNAVFRADPSNPEQRGNMYRDAIRRAPETVTEEWAHRWRSEAAPDPRSAPVFLVGFPRSGTTLIDTILMGHPRVEVLEEEPPLRIAQQHLPNFEGLPTLSEDRIDSARDAYFEAAAELTPLAAGNLLIDKNPLTMNLLPVVRRLFPEARIILALRHPCDVVLSCFMANFRLNDGMSNFLSLETAADLYDASFALYEHVQSLMPFPTHVVKYENVVADRERELRALFDFLNLDWHDAVLDHQSTALNRGRIKTASYAQVVEPIYTRSAGRWQNYRKHLEPIFPVLLPWAEKFGYEM